MSSKPENAPALLSWAAKLGALGRVMKEAQATDADGAPLEPDEAFTTWALWGHQTRSSRKTLFVVGNGASAAMACHVSADLGKNFRLKTHVFTDPSLLTACANDIDYEQVFSAPLSWRGEQGDLLVAISSSGSSPNIVAACREGRRLGMRVVTLTAMQPDNPCRSLGDLNLYVPAKTYGNAETSHAAILHHWIDLLVER